MEEGLYKKVRTEFIPFVQSVFDKNKKYFLYITKVPWDFENIKDDGNLATCKEKDNKIYINIEAFLYLFSKRNLLLIEYLLMHEVRHVFQHDEVKRMKANSSTILDVSFAKQWEFESNHYEKPFINDKENPKYYEQDCEMDAYAFAFAIMKHKYQCKKEDFYSASKYGKDFDQFVDKLIEIFKKIDENFETQSNK